MIRGLAERLGLASDLPGGALDVRARGLLALNRVQLNTYAGTVPAAEVDRRRAHNRAARKSRRINRGRR